MKEKITMNEIKEKPKKKRSIKNILIYSRGQLPLIIFTSIFTIILFQFFLFSSNSVQTHLSRILDVYLLGFENKTIIMTQVDKELFRYLSMVVLIMGGFLILMNTALLIETHRVFGAARNIKRYIDEKLCKKRYDDPLKLRKNDYLQDVAKSLNGLREKLKDSK